MNDLIGKVLEGKVTGITKFGAFVALPDNASGMVHISEVANTYVNDIREHLTEGQEVTVKVIGVDEKGRINLSIKKASAPPPPSAQRPRERFNREPSRSQPQVQAEISFEDKLKQFMKDSESKLSEIKHNLNQKGDSYRRGRR